MKAIKIIKVGGDIIDDAVKLEEFLTLFSNIKSPKVLVHGGGKSATELATKMNVPVQMIGGRRITDSANLEIITMLYAGKINKNIVARLQALNCNAIGMSGADGNTIVAHKRSVEDINFGFVGDINFVNTASLKLFLKNGMVPVFCAITHNELGQLLNTNADTIASELAIALAKEFRISLYYCFEKEGVLENIEDGSTVIKKLNTNTYLQLIEKGLIVGGMLPKLENSFRAVNNQVVKVCIGNPAMLIGSNVNYTTIER
ncbi:acetylglutamate kinase [Tenacibaculum maritimum]|uniref:acetylglutamate kinase n=1 Tax=Tenacibaculum maritimum TaxID=107401 RepID=UPI0012E423E5|nr:acetylglutamate kinase [Tenacibaculum maritimum]CAA0204696.1 acetylglutamate kinase [Tenacibaculum maritimum]CAA0208534.1 acetylglutamate kinase [Tenacibaculum maritimum]CAA0218642.1 acetylglutamate kinase [Tenacibaculum maritimum]CAA0222959.1 acetylglutamate kinase [Tenacibaculum maritimum]